MSLSGVKAGRAYVEITTNDTVFAKGLSSVQNRLQVFGKSVGVAGIAAGNLLAKGIEEGLKQVGKIAQFAYEAAKLDPKTQKDTVKFESALDGLMDALKGVGTSILSMVLPALTSFTEYLTGIAAAVQDGIDWLEQFGVVAALQTGDIASAFGILWRDLQIMFLQGSQALLGYWDGMIAAMLSAWDTMAATILQVLGDTLKDAGDYFRGMLNGIAIVAPAIAKQLEPIAQMAEGLQDLGAGLQTAGSLSADQAVARAAERAKQAEAGQQILQDQIDALRKERNTIERKAIEARDIKRADDIAAFQADKTSIVGTFSSAAAGLIGKQDNTAKEQLNLVRQQKAIAERQERLLKQIAQNIGLPTFG